jgi:hypothetical protein
MAREATMQAELKTIPIPIVARNTLDCEDKDEDCHGVEDKVNCWLYGPERGMCPYLRTDGVKTRAGGQQ